MIHRPSMPAVEYRQLWSRLVEMRHLDPEDQALRTLQAAFVAIGADAGIVIPGHDDGAGTADATLRPDVEWDRDEVALSADAAAVVDRVAKVTVIPE